MMPPLTLDALNNHLWRAADILRGQVDSSDYKGYIFDFLFLKRLSDVFDEERGRLRADAGADPEDHDEYFVWVPERARWASVRAQTENIGDYLNKAVGALEDENPSKLEGVLAGVDFNDDRRLGDARHRDALLSRLINHFSELKLGTGDLPEPDTMGRALEYLIEKFADDAGKKGGEFLTPRQVVRLIVALLAPDEGAGSATDRRGGGMLIECARYIEEERGGNRATSVCTDRRRTQHVGHLQDEPAATWPERSRRPPGRYLRSPQLVRDGRLMLFDG